MDASRCHLDTHRAYPMANTIMAALNTARPIRVAPRARDACANPATITLSSVSAVTFNEPPWKTDWSAHASLSRALRADGASSRDAEAAT
jgi:hypothetical protein